MAGKGTHREVGRVGEPARFVERIEHGTDVEAASVLCVDDEPDLLELLEAYLEQKGEALTVEVTTSPEGALDRLAANDIDCVVSDYQMPEMDGLEFLDAVREEHPDLPFILFTGKGSEEVAERAISAGVTDYLQKGTGSDTFTVLANRIENAVAQYRAQQEARASNRRIRRVFKRITDAFVALDEEWRYTYVNQQAAEVLEHDIDELLGEVIWEKFPELEETAFERALREAMATQEPTTVEEYFEPLDVWFEAHSYPAENGLSIYFRDITDRRERERRYEAIFNQTYQFTGLLKPDGTLLEANEAALEFGGVDREDVIGEKMWDTYWFQVSEATRKQAKADVRRAARGEFVRRELEVQGADRTAVIDFSVKPVTDQQGEVVLLVPEGRDITELTEREQELREERAFTRSIFRALPDVFYAFDPDGNFLRWNDRLETVTGYSGDEIEEMHPLDFVPADEEGKIANGIATVVEEERPVTVESYFETKSGERIPYEFTGGLLEDEDGNVLGITGIGRDISERREQQRRYEAIFNQTYQFTGLMEPDGTLVEANETALEFGGLDREDVIGKKVWDTYWFQVSEETRQQAKADVRRAAAGEFVRRELEVQGEDRTAIIDFSVKPVTDEQGEVVLLVPEGRDITELKERERELQRQNERLDEFASVVTHDLRNPLNVAQGSLEMARETGNEEHIETAERAVDRMEALIEDLLTLARKGQVVSETTTVDLADASERAWATVETREATLDAADAPTIEADDDRLRELLENLFRNAVEHGGADVRVEVGALPDGDDDGDGFYVADDGPGIPDDEREKVFESGYTTTAGGTGFGLAIVRSIAEAHGWEIAATGSDRASARFEVTGVETA